VAVQELKAVPAGEAVVMTCEYCGADAVDARGVCRNCGRLAADADARLDDGLPSLGETRAADLPADLAARTPPGGGSSRTAAVPRHAASASQRPSGGGGTARYCGTCGARIVPGEAFCGQCGSPVGAGPEYTRNMPTSASSRFTSGERDTWEVGDGDAPTEAFDYPPPPVVAPYNRGGLSSGQYAPRYGATPAPPTAAMRTNRTLLGLLCLLGSLLSAAAAVLLAIVK
jgi:hypothetical protein